MMAMFRMNLAYSLVPETVEGLVSVTDSAFVASTINRQVLNANLTVTGTAANTGATASYLGADAALKPTRFSQSFTVFCNPNGSVAGAATNANPLSLGLSNGQTGTLGSEYVFDFSAFASDITGAEASLIQNNTGLRNQAATQTAVVSQIDNVNKLIYVNIVSFASGALSANVATNTIVLDVQFVENGYTA
jgi:hypothetical protein